MKALVKFLSLSLLCIFQSAAAASFIGKLAPAFEVKDAQGKIRTLSSAKGKWLVLEWTNKDCAHVRKHYQGNMQRMQKNYKDKGVLWYSVISSKKGAPEQLSPQQVQEQILKDQSQASAVLIDENSKMAQAYSVRITPYLLVINPEGKVVYSGAVDDNDSMNPMVIAHSKNFVVSALDLAMTGKKVEVSTSRPYGCAF